ncbi:hypothetical protein ACWC4J_03565 [Streptomyces sp. NPDC001356]
MARLQILQLPEGVDDSRPPFALVVDQCAADRWVSRPGNGDHLMSARWREAAELLGARGVIVTAETVEIPANEVPLPEPLELVAEREGALDDERRDRRAELKLKEFAEATYREALDRMDSITDALGFDRLRDWDEIVSAIKRQRQIAADGEHVFGEPGYQDPQRCAQCGLDRNSWIMQRDTRTCSTVRADAESGHEFRPIGARDELACLRCGMPRIEWAVRRDTPRCDVVRQGGE